MIKTSVFCAKLLSQTSLFLVAGLIWLAPLKSGEAQVKLLRCLLMLCLPAKGGRLLHRNARVHHTITNLHLTATLGLRPQKTTNWGQRQQRFQPGLQHRGVIQGVQSQAKSLLENNHDSNQIGGPKSPALYIWRHEKGSQLCQTGKDICSDGNSRGCPPCGRRLMTGSCLEQCMKLLSYFVFALWLIRPM